MPLFGKKKSSKNETQASYPVASYPTAPPHDTSTNQATGSEGQPPPSYASQIGPPPPPQQPYMYAHSGTAYPQPFVPTGYPGQQPPPPIGYQGQQPPQFGYQGQQLPPIGYQGQQPPFPPQYQSPPSPYAPQPAQSPTVVVQGGFDAGARFDLTGATIPPPPPGCPANASQVAAAQGYNVVVTQQNSDFVAGGSDGGMSIW